MVKAQLLGDHPSDGVPDDDDLLEARVLDDREKILSKPLDRVVTLALRLRQSMPAQVVEEKAPALERIHLVVPHVRPQRRAMQEDDASLGTGAGLLDKDARAIRPGEATRAFASLGSEALAGLRVAHASFSERDLLGNDTRSQSCGRGGKRNPTGSPHRALVCVLSAATSRVAGGISFRYTRGTREAMRVVIS